MSMTSKDLGAIASPAGTVRVTLFYDDAVISNASHIPSAAESLLNIGEFIEKLEKKSGVFEFSSVSIEIKDSYDNYTAGVWFKLLSSASEVQFRFYLVEGSTDTFLFWGMVQKDGVIDFKERYISNPGSSGRYVRTGRVSLVSMLSKLKTTSVSSVISQIAANDANDSLGGTSIQFNSLIGCIAVAAFGADASITDSGVFPSGDAEIQFQSTTSTWLNINELYIRVQLSNSPITVSPYFDSLDVTGRYWVGRFTNALELLSFLAKSYGYLVRYFYGQSDGTIGASSNYHRIQFVQRGKTGNVVTMGKPKESSMSFDNILTPTKIYFARFDDTYAYGSDGGDIEQRMDFLWDSGALNNFEKLYYAGGNLVTSVRFFNYSTGDYATSGHTTEAMYYYHFYKINAETRKYRRDYRGVKATFSSTESHRHLVPACRHSIHDGISSRDFYANEVRKNIMKNTSKIEWVEE
ncbi:hypothetical protein [Zoogloea sp.]|uniref:hypothetical protein n=1 Tax=Zoogloea sp. TaxID=49181 RepID=UPI0014164AA8|nr:MAG: hypothetical protein F9K15_12705 [Zoogloea sp.]